MLTEQRAAKIQRRKAQTPANDTHRGNSRRVSTVDTYLFRHGNPELWKQFKSKAALEGSKGAKLKDLIERFIRDYVKDN